MIDDFIHGWRDWYTLSPNNPYHREFSTRKNVDLLSFRAYYDKGVELIGSKSWAGPQSVFKKLWWQVHDE